MHSLFETLVYQAPLFPRKTKDSKLLFEQLQREVTDLGNHDQAGIRWSKKIILAATLPMGRWIVFLTSRQLFLSSKRRSTDIKRSILKSSIYKVILPSLR
jgi:hypothetical protein